MSEPLAFGLQYPGKPEAVALAYASPHGQLRLDTERSWGIESAADVLIEADNLDALRWMRPAYAGRVQCIYIDPPYNTGHDFVYRDRFAQTAREYGEATGLHPNPRDGGRFSSRWLAMMEPRLRVAYELLADDGLCFVSIDDNEVHHLRMLLDEVFGPRCFVAQVVVIGNRGGRDYLRIATTHEYVLVYGKDPQTPVRPLPRPVAPNAQHDARGRYELRELRNRNPRFSAANRPNLFYPIWVDESAEADAPLCPVSVQPRPGWVKVEPRNRKGEASVWRWGKPKLRAAVVEGDAEASEVVARRRRDGVFNIYEKYRATTAKPRSVWDEPGMRSEQGTRTLTEHLGVAAFDHPKPVDLVARCLQLGMDRDGLVLDFFAGSGTTAEAVAQLNAADGGSRRCVLVQVPQPLPPDAAARTLGAQTLADVTRLRVAACRDEAIGLRCFAASDAETTVDAWAAALAAGVPLDAGRDRLDAHTWRWRGPSHSVVVSLAPTIDRQTVDSWGLASAEAVVCRGDALDDTAAFNLARLGPLTLL